MRNEPLPPWKVREGRCPPRHVVDLGTDLTPSAAAPYGERGPAVRRARSRRTAPRASRLLAITFFPSEGKNLSIHSAQTLDTRRCERKHFPSSAPVVRTTTPLRMPPALGPSDRGLVMVNGDDARRQMIFHTASDSPAVRRISIATHKQEEERVMLRLRRSIPHLRARAPCR